MITVEMENGQAMNCQTRNIVIKDRKIQKDVRTAKSQRAGSAKLFNNAETGNLNFTNVAGRTHARTAFEEERS